MPDLGTLLKTAREEKGLTLDEAVAGTHIRYHLLEALEENNFKMFPSPVMTRGLIKNYAAFLGVDPVEALTQYDGKGVLPVKGKKITPNGTRYMNLAMAPRPFITFDLIVGFLLFALIAAGFVYLFFGQNFISTAAILPTPTKTPLPSGISENAALTIPTITPPPTATPTPVPPTATPTAIVYGGVTVELLIRQPSWVQISVDDVKDFEGILQAGESRIWSGERRVAIRAGNAGGVEVVVNGTNRGLMGGEGQVANQLWEKVEDPAILTPVPTETPLPSGSEASFDATTSTEATTESQ